MSSEISTTSIQKLGHELVEIRVRTLKHIEGKILRAFQHNEEIILNSDILMKQLIRWFGRSPPCEEETVLNLMLVILGSTYGHETIKYIGIDRLKKEFKKIHQIFKDTPTKQKLVTSITDLLEEFRPLNGNEIDIIEISSTVSGSTIDLCSLSEVINDDDIETDCERPWSTPSARDLGSIKSLSEALSPECTYKEHEHAFNYLRTAINDYPPEYFLQPPYIFKGLIKLLSGDKNDVENLLEHLSHLTKSITKKVKSRKLSQCFSITMHESNLSSKKTQITVGKYCLDLFNICIEHLKDFNHNIENREIYLILNLMFDLMNLIENDSNTCIPIKSLVIDLAMIAKYYRLSLEAAEKPQRLNRILYIFLMNTIAKLIENGQPITVDSKSFNNNNESKRKQFVSIHSEGHNITPSNTEQLWLTELENALLDFPFREMYPKQYENIYNSLKLNRICISQDLEILLNCKNSFSSAIQILRQPELYKDAEFIYCGYEALNTLSIHESMCFVRKLIETISRMIPCFDGNIRLKTVSESIILRLLAHDNLKIKRLVYKESANSMKYFFGSLMNGEQTLKRLHNPEFQRAKTFGIPLTAEIISEIICFGYESTDAIVKQNAEIMLSLIVKGKSVLEEHWDDMMCVLMPNIAFLQCITTDTTGISKAILNLSNPDVNCIVDDVIQSNLRFLFNMNADVRSEALTRIIYILSKDDNQADYLPNIFQISDTLPNDVCVVTVPRDPKKIFTGGIYDRGTVHGLLQLLKTSDVEPSIRKTTLLQLNVICQDTELNEMISNENGWYYALEALESALKQNPSSDYPDAVIPAIGILSKLCLHNSQFRRDLAAESNIYILLIRALFLFHHDIVLQQDCSLVLFLLLFSNNIVAGNKQISIPIIFNKLKLPIKCDFHWLESPNNSKTKLEEIYAKFRESNKKISNTLTDDENATFRHSPFAREQQIDLSKAALRSNSPLALQFVRMTFAAVWFNGFDTVLKNAQRVLSTGKSNLDYSIIPVIDKNEIGDGVIEITDVFSFNQDLELSQIDLRLIRYTSSTENVKNFFRKITNATNHSDFIDNIYAVQISLIFSSQMEYLTTDIVSKLFRNHMLAQPTNQLQYSVLSNILILYTSLIRAKEVFLLKWILQEIQNYKTCILTQMLKNFDLPIQLYERLCDFFGEFMKCCSDKQFFQKIDGSKKKDLPANSNCKSDSQTNMFNKSFCFFVKIMEECFHKRQLERVRCLVTVIQNITASKCIDVDANLIDNITKKLLYIVTTLKSFSQAGSHLNKNCLLIIGNLMNEIDEFVLESPHVKFLSGFCSHADFEIRALSWSILSKISEALKGSHLIVKELSYLPGGFHACCLSTLLDGKEVSIVRAAAGGLFSNLLSHSININTKSNLHMLVAPLCVEQEPLSIDNGIELISSVFHKHNFYVEISRMLDQFHVSERVQPYVTKELITCEIVRSISSILINFFDLDIQNLEKITDKQFLLKIFQVIKMVPSFISNGSMSMTSEICNLMIRCMASESKFVQRCLAVDKTFISVLIYLLDIKFYDNRDKTTIVNILNLLRLFANEKITLLLIFDCLALSGADCLVQLLVDGIRNNEISSLQNASLKFTTILLLKGEIESSQSMSQIFDSTKIIQKTITSNSTPMQQKEPEKKYRSLNQTDLKKTKKFRKRSYEQSVPESEKCGSEIIFAALSDQFESTFLLKTTHDLQYLTRKTMMCESLAAILKVSPKARTLAQKSNFLSLIIARLNAIFEKLSMSCTDYIRLHGDSKKEPIMHELMILYGVILHWFSVDTLVNDVQINDMLNMMTLTWPWIVHSENLREIFIKALTVLSEDSIQVCKQLSTTFLNPILQSVSKLAVIETNKVKCIKFEPKILKLCLRILINICSCVEGRVQLVKINVLDIFNRFHPSATKLQKTWNIVTLLWLQFWEIFSRHTEGSQLRHLPLLCTLVSKGNAPMRLRCLTVLRNMSFSTTNRSGLLSSKEFLHLLNTTLTEGTPEEKLLVTVMIWKLIADNYKAKHTIKCTSIPRKLKSIAENYSDPDSNLTEIVEIVINILGT